MLSGFMQLRNELIKQLTSCTGCKVSRSRIHARMSNCMPAANILERITELRKVTAKGGVNFVDIGYKNMASRSIKFV
jgi:hypothetical protein